MNISRLFGFTYFFVVLALICHHVNAVPKQYETNSENSSNNWRRRSNNDSDPSSSDRTQRLGHLQGLQGTTAYGNSLGYGGGYGGLGGYNKAPIDLGGVVLGTLIGIGALLILPKLVGVFSGAQGGGYGSSSGYYRSSDDTGVTDMLNRFDDFLAQQNVDSNACMQKAVCHFIRSADYHSNVGTADQIESMVSTISENSIVDYMLEGTAMKDAIANAKNPNGRDCDVVYPACPLDRQSALEMLRKFMPFPGSNRPKETKNKN